MQMNIDGEDVAYDDKKAALFTQMTGATTARLSVDIDPDLECVRLNMHLDDGNPKPQRLLMPPFLALQIALDLAANIERLRRRLEKGQEEEGQL